jgi:aminobenzoyl-glutamate utilization protein B
VTPDEVRVWASLRHSDFDTMRAGFGKMEAVFYEVALAHQVDFRSDLIAACRGYLANDALGRVMAGCLEEVGPPAWTMGDIAFMEELSQVCSPGTPFTLHQELAYFDQGIDYYGQDDGDLSWQVPLGRINWAYPENVPIHHWAWTALSGHSASRAGPLMASEAIAISAVRLIAEPHIVAAAQAELVSRRAGTIVPPPEFGLFDVLTKRPESFWDATW